METLLNFAWSGVRNNRHGSYTKKIFTQRDYFLTALEWWHKIGLDDMLHEANLLPKKATDNCHNPQVYISLYSQFVHVIKTGFGFQPTQKCQYQEEK